MVDKYHFKKQRTAFCIKLPKFIIPVDGGLSSPAAYLPITPLHLLTYSKIMDLKQRSQYSKHNK